ncbi:MAG TPA: nuclear transport factor 2 family protein [Gemmatimonadales bacterium]|jgi:ketosteroid isomerase-like protein
MPTEDALRFAELIQQFGKGWEKGDTAAMVDLYTENAAFYPTPFDPPASGHEAIRAYWKDIPKEQAEIAFRFGEVFVAGPWFSVEFRCTFRRRRTGEPVDLKGALFCETIGDKFSEMRMYWHRAVSR